MGELAIGTNTLAYQTANTYGIYNRLPILLAEKMGPHIAIGDPCFARGEDSPVYNLYGGKEMVARENELTRKRREKPDCYVNFHTDITIPYHEMGLFEGIQKDGTRVTIIQNGRFVPPEAAALNRYLEDM
jgi:leucyl aminopeptidase (aminopeptidase T)